MLPLTRSRNRARFFGIPFSPSVLFEGGTVPGAWYDSSDPSTMFSDQSGTTPVAMPGLGAAVPVGAMLDKRAPAYSVYFDGTGDSLAVPDSAAFTLGSDNFTIECWVNNNTTGARKYVAGQVNSTRADATASFVLEKTSANKLRGIIFQASTAVGYIALSTNDLPLNTWTHVAFVRNGNALTLYINGVADGTVDVTGVTVNDSSNNLAVGAYGESTTDPWLGYISNFRVVKGTAIYTGNFTPPTAPLSPISGTSLLTCGTTWSGNTSITTAGNTRVDGFNPFTVSPVGNHAISFNNTTARPELRARVNLLTYSEDFSNAAWAKFGLNAFGSGSVANTTATLDPLGGNTADYIQENTATASHLVLQAASVGANVQAVFSVYMKAAERTWGVIYPETSGGAGAGVWFNLATGVVGTQGAGRVGSITSVGNGWYRCSVVATLSTDSQRFYLGPASADNTISYTGDGTSGIYIWGADLRPANIGANVPAYQRIADANTYDTNGFPLYLRFDGIDDSMYTPANLDLSGTDKVAVFAGVRKLSDAAVGMLTELSANWNLNAGTFLSVAPDTTGASGDYVSGSRGSAASSTFQFARSAITLAPVTNVFTATHDIPGDLSSIRLNGAANGTNGTADKGAGNFGTYPLYIGSRANSSLWFNGHLHSLIIAGSAVSAGNINATEQWVAGRTGISIP